MPTQNHQVRLCDNQEVTTASTNTSLAQVTCRCSRLPTSELVTDVHKIHKIIHKYIYNNFTSLSLRQTTERCRDRTTMYT